MRQTDLRFYLFCVLVRPINWIVWTKNQGEIRILSRLDVTDCTAFVLTNMALSYSQTIEEAKAMMEYLNYRLNSEMTFASQLHFTIDRNQISPYFEDIKVGI